MATLIILEDSEEIVKEKKKMIDERKKENIWKGLEVQLRKGMMGKEIMEFLKQEENKYSMDVPKKRGIRSQIVQILKTLCISIPNPIWVCTFV